MRLNEICFLRTADIRKAETTWYIDVSASDGRRLKSANAQRKIPTHPQLLQLGFLDWVNSRREAGADADLFPELPVNAQGYRSDGFSKWFGRLRKSVGIGSRETTFHSFRHYFEDRLREATVSLEHQERIMGWGSGHIQRTYGTGPSVELLDQDIRNVRFPELRIDHLF